MQDLSGIDGFPKVFTSGIKKEQPYIVLEKLGISLKDILQQTQRHFSKICILNFGIVMINLLEKLHDKGYIHCDIKPDNIMIGNFNKDPKQNRKIFLIDFGIS